MVQQITMQKQTPEIDGNWLYKDQQENDRIFSRLVCLPDGAELWEECTDAEKVEWEQAHPMPTTETEEENG